MKFDVYGPFELLLTGKRLHAKNARADFIEQTSEAVIGTKTLADACGCYVFTIRAGRGTLPWYVGKTEQRTFSKECLIDRNILMLNDLLHNRLRGRPELFLLPQVTPGGGFVSPTKSKKPPIDFLESMLIGMGVQRNKDLVNINKTKMLRELEVVGVMNTKRRTRTGPAKDLRDVFDWK